jgi:hypothetical protein
MLISLQNSEKRTRQDAQTDDYSRHATIALLSSGAWFACLENGRQWQEHPRRKV